MTNVLVLCIDNSCRSQIGQGFLEKLSKGCAKIYSAGIDTDGLNQLAVKYMKEFSGIDISSQTSNNISEYLDIDFEYIITVCDHARENCPYFPSSATRIHKNFEDPSKVPESDEEIKEAFRVCIDEIKAFCMKFTDDHL